MEIELLMVHILFDIYLLILYILCNIFCVNKVLFDHQHVCLNIIQALLLQNLSFLFFPSFLLLLLVIDCIHNFAYCYNLSYYLIHSNHLQTAYSNSYYLNYSSSNFYYLPLLQPSPIWFVVSKNSFVLIDWHGVYGLTNSGNIVPIFSPISGLNVLSIYCQGT